MMRDMWAYDFVFDAFADGRHLKCLTVIEEYVMTHRNLLTSGR